jgi:hypothetical protein
MSLPKLKRPVGRQSLAELLADLAGQVDDLKLAFEFYSSPIAELIVQVDREDVVEGRCATPLYDRLRLMPRRPSEEAAGPSLEVAPKEAAGAFIEEFKEVPLLDGELPLELTLDHEATETLDTDDLLLLAAHRRIGMDDRWETMEREGGTDLEIRAALGRAFDLGVLGKKGVVHEPGGCCCFEGGDLPKFWSGKTNFEGRPTLEGKALVERARRVLEIPLEAGGTPPPKTKARGRKVKFAS